MITFRKIAIFAICDHLRVIQEEKVKTFFSKSEKTQNSNFWVEKTTFFAFFCVFRTFSSFWIPFFVLISGVCRRPAFYFRILGYPFVPESGSWNDSAHSPPRKITKMSKKWDFWVQKSTHFWIFLARAGHKWPLFSQLGKKGTQNGFTGVWSHFCYTEMSQKWAQNRLIFEAEIEKKRKKINFFKKTHFFRKIPNFFDSEVSRPGGAFTELALGFSY